MFTDVSKHCCAFILGVKQSAYACPDDEDATSKHPLLCTNGHGVTSSGRHEPWTLWKLRDSLKASPQGKIQACVTFQFMQRLSVASRRCLQHPCLMSRTGKVKAVPLQAWSDPEDSRKLRFPDFTTMAQYGGKVVSLTHRPPLPRSKCSWYSFLLETESTPGP